MQVKRLSRENFMAKNAPNGELIGHLYRNADGKWAVSEFLFQKEIPASKEAGILDDPNDYVIRRGNTFEIELCGVWVKTIMDEEYPINLRGLDLTLKLVRLQREPREDDESDLTVD